MDEWKLVGAWAKKLEFGSLDYTKDDLVEVSMTIAYDYAEYTSMQNGKRQQIMPPG